MSFIGAGIGYRRAHRAALLAGEGPPVLEIMPDHFFAEPDALAALAERYRLVFHDVGLSLGTVDDAAASRARLARIKPLVRDASPLLFTEHLALTRSPSGIDLGHLAPLWRTPELLDHVVDRVRAIEDVLGVPVALENIASPFEHTILDCKITSQVLLGEAEMVVELSGRLLELQIRTGETAEAYAERVKTFAAQPDSFEPPRQWLGALTGRVAAALGQVLVGAKVTQEDASVQLIRPDARQIRRFDQLGFGEDVESPAYRPVPTLQRAGAYADPFYYYHYDPYYDYMNFVLVDAMIHESMWHSPHVMVVDPIGTPLFSGLDAGSHANDGWIGHAAVNYDSDGHLALNDTLASWSNDDDSAWGNGASSCSSSSSSCSSSSCSSSSCGSSCNSGSSCGSSCSSGSSCGSSSD